MQKEQGLLALKRSSLTSTQSLKDAQNKLKKLREGGDQQQQQGRESVIQKRARVEQSVIPTTSASVQPTTFGVSTVLAVRREKEELELNSFFNEVQIPAGGSSTSTSTSASIAATVYNENDQDVQSRMQQNDREEDILGIAYSTRVECLRYQLNKNNKKNKDKNNNESKEEIDVNVNVDVGQVEEIARDALQVIQSQIHAAADADSDGQSSDNYEQTAAISTASEVTVNDLKSIMRAKKDERKRNKQMIQMQMQVVGEEGR